VPTILQREEVFGMRAIIAAPREREEEEQELVSGEVQIKE